MMHNPPHLGEILRIRPLAVVADGHYPHNSVAQIIGTACGG